MQEYVLTELETKVIFRSQIKTVSIDINELNARFELNERQKKAVEYLAQNGKMTNKEYKAITKLSSVKTAFRDLQELTEKGIIQAEGQKKGRYYTLKIS